MMILYADVHAELTPETYQYTYTAENNDAILSLNIENYTITLENKDAEEKINKSIEKKTQRFVKIIDKKAYPKAKSLYEKAQKEGREFRTFEIMSKSEVSLNNEKYVSGYNDIYDYKGGANGRSLRFADTWDVTSGYSMKMEDFFKKGTDVKKAMTGMILKQAKYNHAKDPTLYVEDYQKEIMKHFREDHFYLSEEGLVVYYQQNTIAPHASGIVEFLIPYDYLNA